MGELNTKASWEKEEEESPVTNWGPVSDNDTFRIILPNSGDPPQWVDVKRYITEEDDSIASDAAMQEGMKVLGREQRRKIQKKATRSDMQIFFKSGTYRMVLLRRVVKAWSFTRGGQPIPVTPESIVSLPTMTRDYIMEKLDEMNPSLQALSDEEDEEEGNDGIHPLDESTGSS